MTTYRCITTVTHTTEVVTTTRESAEAIARRLAFAAISEDEWGVVWETDVREVTPNEPDSYSRRV